MVTILCPPSYLWVLPCNHVVTSHGSEPGPIPDVRPHHIACFSQWDAARTWKWAYPLDVLATVTRRTSLG